MTEPMTSGRLDELRAVADIWPGARFKVETLDALLDEIGRQAAEIEAFRRAVREDDGPSCEDVCLKSCIGVCGAGVEVVGDVD